MELSRTIEILSALAQGVDPYTGEVFPDESPYHRVETVRALFVAVEELRNKTIAGKLDKKKIEMVELSERQKELFEVLRQWRLEQAKQEFVENYMIFSNDTLSRVALIMPETMDDLSKIKGFGEVKKSKYGLKIVELVKEFNAS